jgi:hypothetical protein
MKKELQEICDILISRAGLNPCKYCGKQPIIKGKMASHKYELVKISLQCTPSCRNLNKLNLVEVFFAMGGKKRFFADILNPGSEQAKVILFDLSYFWNAQNFNIYAWRDSLVDKLRVLTKNDKTKKIFDNSFDDLLAGWLLKGKKWK